MINHNSRGLVGDLVDAGVYEEDFELVWANKRDEDAHDNEPSIQTPPSPPSPPNPPANPEPELQSTSTSDSTSTTAKMTTETSTSIATASATPTATLILQTAASVSSPSTLSISTSASSSEPSSTSITSVYTPTSSKSSPETTITSTTTSMLNATALTAHNPTISPLSNDPDTTKEHQHTSSALAVTVSVTVIVSLLVLAVMSFLVRRRILRQRKRGNVLKDIGEKPNPGMEAWAGVIPRAKGNGMRNSVFSGIRSNGIRNSIFPQAPRPALIRNSSVSTAGTARDLDRYEKETGEGTVRAPSTMSLDWGDGVSIHSLETTDSEQPQGLGVRPQRKMSLIQDSEENDIESGDGSQGILSYYANMKYHRNPFADPEPNLNMDTSFSSIQLPNFEFDTWGDDTNRLSRINPQSPGDLTRDNSRKNTLSSLRPTSFLSETDTLESQKAMARASFGGALGHLGTARWSNPFSAKEKRGTRGYEEMGELEREERGEGKWKDKLSWVKGQVDRVKN
ncbi:uncharacterized protein EAF01_003150 [Botrytis porri]|uniref:Uncharacterized protein n=1 Tax=Botrytis porri TaxID=87229 RepID=A0A4Z1KBB8_9HELO|nr:uncharacterized protein EAF01_003150 [Botrytis porri]KAF7909432.1 hypothetical protein EAF01_003150 [Botrytis porri]TGO83461.1 hypothetical protein BPOR_0643g00010 [Botrytis porri]